MKRLIISTGLILLLAAPSFAYICGDADGDQNINISDAVYLVNFIFKGGPQPDPVEAGDVNLDGDLNIGDPVYLINYIFKGGPAPCPIPGGNMTGTSGCKGPYKSPDTLSNLDCLGYDYDGMGTLTLTHINSAYNCCPEEMFADVVIQGDTILITESETYGEMGFCYCLCLFDIYITVTGLMPGEYTIIIDGMYLEGRPPIDVTLEFNSETTGVYCLERDIYPWQF